MSDVIDVLEACYAPAASDDDWLRAIVDRAAPHLDRGYGVSACIYDFSDRLQNVPRCFYATTESARLYAEDSASNAAAVPEFAGQFFFGQARYGTASEKSGLGEAWAQHPAVVSQTAMGMPDVLGLITADPTGIGCLLAAPMPAIGRASRGEVAIWSRIAAHLSAGLRLRDPTRPSTANAEAIVSPNGRIEHAEDPAKSRASRDALARGAASIDRARGRRQRRDELEAVGIWHGLVDGRWSLVETFDHDGRRYFVARQNDAPTPDRAPLTARERQVLAQAALGHSNKLVAYELGLAPSTVASHLAHAAKKLGAHSRAALIRTWNSPGGSACPPRPRSSK